MAEQAPISQREQLAKANPRKEKLVKTKEGKYKKEKTSKGKKREFKKNGKPIKGLYYHAAEFERKKQQERGMIGRMAASFFEPFALQLRRIQLGLAVKEYRDTHNGEEPILTEAFVKRSLGHLGQKWFFGSVYDQQQANEGAAAAGRAHKTILRTITGGQDTGNIMDYGKVQRDQAQILLQKVAGVEGNLTPENIQKIAAETNVSPDEVAQLGEDVKLVFQEAHAAKIKFETPDQMKQAITEQLLYAGLSPKQQEQAKKVARNAAGLLVLGIARTATLPVLAATGALGVVAGVGALALGTPGAIAATAAVGAAPAFASRVGTLRTQGATYDTNTERGVSGITDKPHELKGVEKWIASTRAMRTLGRLMSVDWNKDSRTWQVIRAAGAGALIGLALKFGPELPGVFGDIGNFAHGISEHVPSLGHGHGTTGGEHAPSPTPTFSGPTQEVQVPGFANTEIKIPDNWHFGVALNHQDPHTLYDNQGNEVASHFSLDHGQMSFDFTKPYADGNGITELHQTIASGTGETDSFSQFVTEHSSTQLQLNHPSADLPAGGQEAYGMTDYTDGHSFIIQSYDHLGDQSNALVAQVHENINGQDVVHNVVFSPTGHTPDGHPLWEFTPGGKSLVTVWQDGHEVQVTSGEAADMLHITQGEITNWAHANPANMSSDFDYPVGQNILGHNLLFGNVHEDAQGHFVFDQLGQIRGHSGDLTSAGYANETVFDFTSKIGEPEIFHSIAAPVLSTADSGEDWVIAWLAQHGFGNEFAHDADALTDLGLNATDYVSQGWLLPVSLAAYLASGYGGYKLARKRAHGQKVTRGQHIETGIGEGILLSLLPGAAVGAAIGNIYGRLRNWRQRKREQKETKPPGTDPSATPTPTQTPSTANAATVAAEAAATVPATIAVEETAQIPPAPPAPTAVSPTPEAEPTPTGAAEATLATAAPSAPEAVVPPPAIEEVTATEPVAQTPVTVPPSSTPEDLAAEAAATPVQAEIAAPALNPAEQEVAEAGTQGTYPDQLKLLEDTFPAGNTLQANQGGDYEQFEIIGYVKDGENWKIIANGKKGDQIFQGLSYNMDQLEKLVAAGQTQNVQNTVLPIAPDLVSHIGETIPHNNDTFHIYGVGIKNGHYVYVGRVINSSNGAEDMHWETVDANVIA